MSSLSGDRTDAAVPIVAIVADLTRWTLTIDKSVVQTTLTAPFQRREKILRRRRRLTKFSWQLLWKLCSLLALAQCSVSGRSCLKDRDAFASSWRLGSRRQILEGRTVGECSRGRMEERLLEHYTQTSIRSTTLVASRRQPRKSTEYFKQPLEALSRVFVLARFRRSGPSTCRNKHVIYSPYSSFELPRGRSLDSRPWTRTEQTKRCCLRNRDPGFQCCWRRSLKFRATWGQLTQLSPVERIHVMALWAMVTLVCYKGRINKVSVLLTKLDLVLSPWKPLREVCLLSNELAEKGQHPVQDCSRS